MLRGVGHRDLTVGRCDNRPVTWNDGGPVPHHLLGEDLVVNLTQIFSGPTYGCAQRFGLSGFTTWLVSTSNSCYGFVCLGRSINCISVGCFNNRVYQVIVRLPVKEGDGEGHHEGNKFTQQVERN